MYIEGGGKQRGGEMHINIWTCKRKYMCETKLDKHHVTQTTESRPQKSYFGNRTIHSADSRLWNMDCTMQASKQAKKEAGKKTRKRSSHSGSCVPSCLCEGYQAEHHNDTCQWNGQDRGPGMRPWGAVAPAQVRQEGWVRLHDGPEEIRATCKGTLDK